jgi:hypothetical protein
MLRYKNSLLERILLEKGTVPTGSRSQLHMANANSSQASMCKLNCEPKPAAHILAQPMCLRTWCSHRRSNGPS